MPTLHTRDLLPCRACNTVPAEQASRIQPAETITWSHDILNLTSEIPKQNIEPLPKQQQSSTSPIARNFA